MKKRVSISLFLLIAATVLGIFSAYSDSSDSDKCRRLLNDCGWEIKSTPHDTAQITIPKVFDKIYENYNILQKNSGFDLLPYCGKSGTRYTFIVTNYPVDTGEAVYANVIAIDGEPVGGDIMTVSLSGFMHGLKENTPKN